MTITVILREKEKEYEADYIRRFVHCFAGGHELELLVMHPWTLEEAGGLIARARAVAGAKTKKTIDSHSQSA